MNKNTGTVPDNNVNCQFTFELFVEILGQGAILREWVVYGDGLILISFVTFLFSLVIPHRFT